MAPEMMKGLYTKETDLWSVGVITYMLLSSQMPFCGNNRAEIIAQIANFHVEFTGLRWQKVSKLAKFLLSDLLLVHPNKRATANAALQCHWLNHSNLSTEKCNSDCPSKLVSNKYNDENSYDKKVEEMIHSTSFTSKEIDDDNVGRATFLKLAAVHNTPCSTSRHYMDMFL
jgi:serine/threonine protein kinase